LKDLRRAIRKEEDEEGGKAEGPTQKVMTTSIKVRLSEPEKEIGETAFGSRQFSPEGSGCPTGGKNSAKKKKKKAVGQEGEVVWMKMQTTRNKKKKIKGGGQLVILTTVEEEGG